MELASRLLPLLFFMFGTGLADTCKVLNITRIVKIVEQQKNLEQQGQMMGKMRQNLTAATNMINSLKQEAETRHRGKCPS